MAEELSSVGIPVPERLLRDLSRDPSRAILEFAGDDQSPGVMQLQKVIFPVLETAEILDLSPSHRAAASNLICAIIENCQGSTEEVFRNAVLDDSIWMRVFKIYLERSDGTKGKSMRQLLLTLSGVLIKTQDSLALRLRDRAVSTFMEIICQRQDRLQVKPALQGLAYFLQKGLTTVPDLVALYSSKIITQDPYSLPTSRIVQEIFRFFLSWIVHHDTALSAGHLVKSFLGSLRQNPSQDTTPPNDQAIFPLWIEPVVETLHMWQDRVQEFKTHVFPHCFLPDIHEYLRFLSYLHFDQHIPAKGSFPDILCVYDGKKNGLTPSEEFEILLAALQSGKELGIIKDVGAQQKSAVEVHGNTVHLRESIFGDWMSHPEPEVRLAGAFLSVFSTAVTRPLTGGVLRSLKRNLVHLHTDTDANFRKEVLTHIQRLFERMKGSTTTISKSKASKSSDVRTRIQISPACRKTARKGQAGLPQDPLADALEFMIWYTCFLESELRPTASYQQRITALKALTIVLRCGLDPDVPSSHLSKSALGQLRWALGMQISNPQLLRSLLDLILDPFDDIRGSSASLLEICLASTRKEEKMSALLMIPDVIKRAELMMLQTGRADQADGVARAYCLLFSQCNDQLPETLRISDTGFWSKVKILEHLTSQLEETIEIARKDLSVAVNGRPVHGTFAALRYILDSAGFYADIALLPANEFRVWKLIHERICACFENLWACIHSVLCADAPEGHIPEEFDEEASLDTKEILSYSWRGLKEASILLRTVVSKAPIGNDEASLLSSSDIERLGKLCFLQLVELRHRGAFSTVAQTFAVFCRRCVVVENERLRELPAIWYQETLLCIQAKADSITRRSAGIPSLMTAIIAAEEKIGGSPLFLRAVKDLFGEASQDAHSSNIQESRLPQVHALNCIKEIFMTSKLSATSEAYIGDGLDLAARTLNSRIWPIRNCGLMLFKALIERLLGSDEAQDWKEQNRTKTSRFSYNKYPHLLGILTNLLDPNGPLQKSMAAPTGSSPMDLHGAEGVFPALQILRQAPPHDPHRHTITKLVWHLLSSPHWHLRDMAARTLVSLHLPHEYYDAMKLLAQDLKGPHNKQHGVLLSLKYMLRQYLLTFSGSNAAELNDVLVGIEAKARELCSRASCPFTKAAFIDLFSQSDLALAQNRRSTSQTDHVWSRFSPILETLSAHESTQGNTLLQRSISIRTLIANIIPITCGDDSTPTAQHAERVRKELTRLAYREPDTCCAFLRCLGDIICLVQSTTQNDLGSRLLSYVHELIITVEDEEVVSECQAVLAESLASKETRQAFFELISEADVFKSFRILQEICLTGSPSSMQSALHLLGYFLDFAFQAFPSRREDCVRQAVYYIRTLRMTMIDTNPFDSRFSAVRSLSALKHIWLTDQSSLDMQSLILGFVNVLYDMLNDDDNEIRDQAAAVASRLLRAQGVQSARKNAVPMITIQRLGRFLATSYSDSAELCREALRRLTGTCNGVFSSQPFAKTLAQARSETTALFVQEKQNLYKDDALDVTFWASVLRTLSTRATRPKHVMQAKRWVLEGLAALTETARLERDGSLGWTTKTEVFVLGVRVLCAADVLLRWNYQGVLEVKMALRKFADVGIEAGVNGIWLEKTERVLQDSVLRSLQRVHLSLPAV